MEAAINIDVFKINRDPMQYFQSTIRWNIYFIDGVKKLFAKLFAREICKFSVGYDI